MEILVEQDMVAPVGVGLKFFRSTVDRPPTLRIPQEYPGKPVRDFLSHLEEVH